MKGEQGGSFASLSLQNRLTCRGMIIPQVSVRLISWYLYTYLWFVGNLFSTLQIVSYLLQENNLSQCTYPPQISDRLRGGNKKSTPQGGIELNPGFFSVYRG